LATSRFGPAVLGVAVVGLSACSPAYVARAVYEEAWILLRRQPIEKMLAEDRLTPAERTRLELVLEARRFAADQVGLDVDGSYSTVSRANTGAVVYVLTAAERDRLESYKWWFPIVGKVPYKGFFSKRKAEAAAAELEERGYDTYVRPSVAFSTLGWFDDPLLSSLLKLDTVTLLNVVIHELFHNTVFLAGEITFDESAANFVGSRGVVEFFCEGPPERRRWCAEASAEWRDAILVSRFLDDELARLREFYKDARGDPELLRARGRVFAGISRRFRALALESDRYDEFLDEPINNASLLHDRLYYRDLEVFEELFRRRGGLRRSVDALKTIEEEGSDRPFERLHELAGPARLDLAVKRNNLILRNPGNQEPRDSATSRPSRAPDFLMVLGFRN
jgi:predicted aminopeptidase